jgi:hypothetical protein
VYNWGGGRCEHRLVTPELGSPDQAVPRATCELSVKVDKGYVVFRRVVTMEQNVWWVSQTKERVVACGAAARDEGDYLISPGAPHLQH